MVDNVVGQVVGGEKIVCDGVSTVGDVRRKMNVSSEYTATVNGDNASDSSYVSRGAYVAFSRKVKGGLN